MTDLENKQLEELTRKVDRIYQGLFGVSETEDKGMCGKVKELEAGYATLNRNYWILVALLTGLGIIGGGIWGLIAK